MYKLRKTEDASKVESDVNLRADDVARLRFFTVQRFLLLDLTTDSW